MSVLLQKKIELSQIALVPVRNGEVNKYVY